MFDNNNAKNKQEDDIIDNFDMEIDGENIESMLKEFIKNGDEFPDIYENANGKILRDPDNSNDVEVSDHE